MSKSWPITGATKSSSVRQAVTLFAYYKIGAFLLLQATLAILIVAVLAGLLFNTDKESTDNSPKG